MRKWYVDIGAEVKKGQVMVDLDVPDVEEELRQVRATAKQAQATVAQSKSQLELARTNNARYVALAPSGVVSQQQIDSYASAFDVQQSNVLAAQAASGSADANVRRVEDLRSFGTIVAPFDGVVTMRDAEIGQLVVSGTGQGQALFKVAEVDVVRFFVNVPQLYASGIQVGMDAPTKIREAPERVFTGKVRAHVERARRRDPHAPRRGRHCPEPRSRARRRHVRDGVVRRGAPRSPGLRAGHVGRVRRERHARGAAIDAEGVVRWKKVTIEADLGDRLAIGSGVAEGERVALTAERAPPRWDARPRAEASK